MANEKDLDKIIMDASVSFGYNELKVEQHQALKAFVEGRDVFVAIPTGYGKSLCYALLPAIFDSKKGLVGKTSICMIVSPLIALMKDQSNVFIKKGISSGFVSDIESINKDMKRKIRKGECQLVFIIPEALFLDTEWRRMLSSDLYRTNLVGFIVDEAHCVKKW